MSTISSILSYQPTSTKSESLLSIDLDQRTLQGRLALLTQEGLNEAQGIYNQGAFVEPYAFLTVTSKFTILDDEVLNTINMVVQGQTESGATVQGVVVQMYSIDDDDASQNTSSHAKYMLKVQYDPLAECAVGGNPTPITAGCT